ncbi:hypothetical protein EDC94DRAFT_509976 [Helicostylum pulchrum]|nr:hypothetical protein EDC94DRAFT_509976 [Helicostylum pulchrum]
MRQRKNAELTKWVRDIRKCKHNYFDSKETKLYMYKVTRKSILASQKLLCAQEEEELYEELL